jgi:hypothetical protein
MYDDEDERPTLPMWADTSREPTYSKSNKRNTFVPATVDRQPVRIQRVEVLPPEEHELAAPGLQRTVNTLATTHFDRAKGFSIATLPLAVAVGVGALLIGLLFFGLDLWSLAAVTTLFLAFLATWLIAWIAYQLTSPDGVNLFTAWAHYRLLRFEQRARLRRMRGEE